MTGSITIRPFSLLWWFMRLPQTIILAIAAFLLGARFFSSLIPFLIMLIPVGLGLLGFIFNAPLPTPIARATGADRRSR